MSLEPILVTVEESGDIPGVRIVEGIAGDGVTLPTEVAEVIDVTEVVKTVEVKVTVFETTTEVTIEVA